MSDISVTESSGTTVTHDHRHPFSTNGLLNDASQSDTEVAQSDGEEQALESHEVIELQTFSERKTWIEHKIEVLYASLFDGQLTDRHLVPGERRTNYQHRTCMKKSKQPNSTILPHDNARLLCLGRIP
jgi:hypothetical protein